MKNLLMKTSWLLASHADVLTRDETLRTSAWEATWLLSNAWFLACGFSADSRACWLWVLTSFVPSPLRIPVCHESKSHTKWLLSV